jgi:nitrate reductase NapE
MSASPTETQQHADLEPPASRTRELALFVLLAVVIWPFIAVGVVAGWGLLVWIYQAFAGPPGPPA